MMSKWIVALAPDWHPLADAVTECRLQVAKHALRQQPGLLAKASPT